MQVAKWGNSLAIRIPASIVHILDLKEGDDIAVVAAGSPEVLLLERTPDPRAAREAMLKRLREFRGRLPADWKIDRDEANAR
ncbi:MAG: AbrB/MazE/SpoVT family DNA-binding domain-containing protein [Sandarakinorhabdus sp.]|nr:AbrB/MazE/SpoVT family DNA-binding domain-containing protein [Sandarakinorhabdus sp.]